jgi:hypothetical protein
MSIFSSESFLIYQHQVRGGRREEKKGRRRGEGQKRQISI